MNVSLGYFECIVDTGVGRFLAGSKNILLWKGAAWYFNLSGEQGCFNNAFFISIYIETSSYYLDLQAVGYHSERTVGILCHIKKGFSRQLYQSLFGAVYIVRDSGGTIQLHFCSIW